MQKERDLELAAKIGKNLLEQNQTQSERIEELEAELERSRDQIGQLRHDICSKKDLLKTYFKNEGDQYDQQHDDDGTESDGSELYFSLDESLNRSSAHNRPHKTSHVLSRLERRVNTLESENKKLKDETLATKSEIEQGESKELQLIEECTRQLGKCVVAFACLARANRCCVLGQRPPLVN